MARSVSRTVEYAYNDFCIANLAKELGHEADHERYLKRATNWHNLFKDQNLTADGTNGSGFTGFLQPRYLNGTWGFQDPILCSPLLDFDSCYLKPGGRETYEGRAALGCIRCES
jgi:putative alpha-1,2-mannosidase